MRRSHLRKGQVLIESGQTLVEALIALAVGAVVIIAATILTQTSLTSSQTSKNQSIATKYAQEGLELARKVRAAPTPNPVTYCVARDDISLSTVGSCNNVSNIDGEFMREVTLSIINPAGPCGSLTYQVKSVVSWTDGKCSALFCRNVELVTCLAP